MDFLDFCERAAHFAQVEAALVERQQEAEIRADAIQARQIADQLEAAGIEKRIALGQAIHFQWVGILRPSF